MKPTDNGPSSSLPEELQRLGALVLMKPTGSLPFAVASRAGIAVESTLRGSWSRYLSLVGRWTGVATRMEVERLRELSRALELRVELLEAAQRPKSGRSSG